MVKILLMGVSGTGKTYIGRALANRLKALWIDGDEHHSDENIALMKAGIPLTDEQRIPWLKTLAALLNQDTDIVMACSAPREQYRKQLLHKSPDCIVIWLDAPKKILQQRLEERSEHFFSPSLLTSQLKTLEPPVAAFRIDSTQPIEEIMTKILSDITSTEPSY